MDNSDYGLLNCHDFSDILEVLYCHLIDDEYLKDELRPVYTNLIAEILSRLGDKVENINTTETHSIHILHMLGIYPEINIKTFKFLIDSLEMNWTAVYSGCFKIKGNKLVISSPQKFSRIFRQEYGNQYDKILKCIIDFGDFEISL